MPKRSQSSPKASPAPLARRQASSQDSTHTHPGLLARDTKEAMPGHWQGGRGGAPLCRRRGGAPLAFALVGPAEVQWGDGGQSDLQAVPPDPCGASPSPVTAAPPVLSPEATGPSWFLPSEDRKSSGLLGKPLGDPLPRLPWGGSWDGGSKEGGAWWPEGNPSCLLVLCGSAASSTTQGLQAQRLQIPLGQNQRAAQLKGGPGSLPPPLRSCKQSPANVQWGPVVTQPPGRPLPPWGLLQFL